MRNHRLGRRTTFAKKLLTSARLVKTTVINTVKKVYYYYSSGGIGVGNLSSRYGIFFPGDYTNGVAYQYIRTTNWHASTPPFPYDWTASIYKIRVPLYNSTTGVEWGQVEVPLNKIEYGGDSTNTYSFERHTNWVLASTGQAYELIRNSWLRIKKSDLEALALTPGVGYHYGQPVLVYSEVWGTGVFPTGVTYLNEKPSSQDNSWTIKRYPPKPVINFITSNGNGTITVNITLADTSSVTPIPLAYVIVYDPTGANGLFTQSIPVSIYGQPVTTNVIVPGFTIGNQYTLKIMTQNDATTGTTFPQSILSSVFTA